VSKIIGIKAVSFDVDGTLWDFEGVMRRSLHYVLKELRKSDLTAARMLTVEKMIEIRDKVANELKGKVIDLEKVRLEAFRRTLREVGRPNDALASHLNEVFFKHRFEDVKLFDDTIPTLKTLQSKYTIGLVSNSTGCPQQGGLKSIFKFLVFSRDCGVEKPDARIFQIALEKVGCSSGQFLHVGDSLQYDVLGASKAGIKCVWLNRKHEKNNLNLKIDYEISSLLELPEILA
jgi:2-haloalkanoic acid dehalogenase type II